MKIYFILLVCLSIIPYRVLFHKPHIEQIKIRVGKDYKPISVFKEEPVIWKFKVKKRKLGLKKKELRKANNPAVTKIGKPQQAIKGKDKK